MKMRIENKTVSKATNGGRYGGIGSVMQKRNGFDYLRICDVVTWKQFMIPHNVFFAQMDRWQRPDGSWKSQNNQGYKYHYVLGGCGLHCASDIKYGVREWESIQGIPSLVNCLERKETFECHPSPLLVYTKVLEIVSNI